MKIRLVHGRDLDVGDVLIEMRPGGAVAKDLVTRVVRDGQSVVAWVADTDVDGRRVCICADASLLVAAEAS